MEIKRSKAPKILGFVALSFSFLALIFALPLEYIFKLLEEGLYNFSREGAICFNLMMIHSLINDEFFCFLTSLIIPIALLLIPRENGKKKAILFIIITSSVILLQLISNIICYIVINTTLFGRLSVYVSTAISFINGRFVLVHIKSLIGCFEYQNSYVIIRALDQLGYIISSILYILQNILCLIGFITLLKKNKTLHQLEE